MERIRRPLHPLIPPDASSPNPSKAPDSSDSGDKGGTLGDFPDSNLILVTGGTGQTGECVVPRLIAGGYRVRILTRFPEKPLPAPLMALVGGDKGGDQDRNPEGNLTVGQLEIREGDLNSPWTLWEALEGARALVHLAHVRFGRTCVQGCEKIGVRRLIALSSTRRFTKWPCETSKAVIRGERAISRSSLDWTILRATMIYGPRDNNIRRLITWVQRHHWVPLVGGGRSLIQPVHVEDISDLVVRALEEPRCFGRTLNVAGPEPVAYRRLWEMVAEATGRRVIFLGIPSEIAVAAAAGIERLAPGLRIKAEQVRRLCENKDFDSGEVRTLLNFTPRPLHEGIHYNLTRMNESRMSSGAGNS